MLTLPLISMLAFIMTWNKEQEMGTITALARETMILVPLGLPFTKNAKPSWATYAIDST